MQYFNTGIYIQKLEGNAAYQRHWEVMANNYIEWFMDHRNQFPRNVSHFLKDCPMDGEWNVSHNIGERYAHVRVSHPVYLTEGTLSYRIHTCTFDRVCRVIRPGQRWEFDEFAISPHPGYCLHRIVYSTGHLLTLHFDSFDFKFDDSRAVEII